MAVLSSSCVRHMSAPSCETTVLMPPPMRWKVAPCQSVWPTSSGASM
jgi:hypothetical protein